MEDLFDPEELVLCPYDSSHHIRRCKMSFHLVKCKANHGDQKRVPCDFNATHMIPEPELQYHHQTCPDRRNIEARIVEYRTKSTNKFPVPNIQIEADESWDDYNTPSYDPKKYSENNDVLRQLDVASGAKKKNFRYEERRRLSQLSRENKEANKTQANDEQKVGVSLPSHRSVDVVQEDVLCRSQLKEKLKKGANKVFLQFDGN